MEIVRGRLERYKKENLERELEFLQEEDRIEEGISEGVDELYYEIEKGYRESYVRGVEDIRLRGILRGGNYGYIELEPKGVEIEIRYKKGKIEGVYVENKLRKEKEKLEGVEIEGVKEEEPLLETRGEVILRGKLSKKGEGYIGLKKELKRKERKIKGVSILIDKIEGGYFEWKSKVEEYKYIEELGYKTKEGEVLDLKRVKDVVELYRKVEELGEKEVEYEVDYIRIESEGEELRVKQRVERLVRESKVKEIREKGSYRSYFEVELENGEGLEVGDYGKLKILNIKEGEVVRYVKGLGYVKVEREGEFYEIK